MRKKLALFVTATMLFLSCAAIQEFVAIPQTLDRTAVPHQVVEMQAERYDFLPEVVKVKAGTLVTLRITAIDGTHGFALDAFGIDERIGEGETREVEFYAPREGEYEFHCSHLCGLGHLGMNGKVVVE